MMRATKLNGRHDNLEDQAANWLARRELGLSVEEQAEFSRWLLEDSRHASAVKEIEAVWRFMQTPRFTQQTATVLQQIDERVKGRNRVRRLAVIGASVAAAAALVFAFLPTKTVEADRGIPVTKAGLVQTKPERQILADDSVVELNLGAEIEVAFTPETRAVRLVRGEAHFQVAKNPARPFIVSAGAVAVRAIGTEFAVRFEPTAVDVLVTEGRVAVARLAEPDPAGGAQIPTEPIFLSAGRHLKVPAEVRPDESLQVEPVSPEQIKSALAWRGMRVEFTDIPLSEVVELFNRQNRVQLRLGAPALGGVRISGIFWADDPEGFSRLIEASAGLKPVHESDTRIVLHGP